MALSADVQDGGRMTLRQILARIRARGETKPSTDPLRWLETLDAKSRAQLHRRARIDLARRSVAGLLGNLILVFLVLIGTPYTTEHPGWAWSFASAIVAVGLVRLAAARALQQVPVPHPGFWRAMLVLGTYGNAVVWSTLLSAAIVVSWNQWPMWLSLFCGAGISAGASTALASDRRLAAGYITILLVPPLLLLLGTATMQSVILAFVIGTYAIFLLHQIHSHHHWYWQALRDNVTIVELHRRLQDATRADAQRTNERRLQAVLDAAPFGAHLYDLRDDSRLVFATANRSADRMLGIDHRALVERTIEQAFPSLRGTGLPNRFREVAREGVPWHLDRFEYADADVRGIFEVHAVQVESNRVAVFFRDVGELAKAYDETLVGWSRAMEVRDRETEGHTQRVTAVTVRLAQAMGVGDDDLLHIRWGALLHDIGKMGVPDAILLKESALTPDESAVMQKHPEIAHQMLSEIGFLRRALEIPLCHHEKWDGTGYPRGLAGKEIPLAARIFAVADVWDALTCDRPYRKGWSISEARAYIQSQAGRHFDPDVVDAFLRLELQP